MEGDLPAQIPIVAGIWLLWKILGVPSAGSLGAAGRLAGPLAVQLRVGS